MDGQSDYLIKARAAIKAMQVPTPAIASVGMHRIAAISENAGWCRLALEGGEIWREMIDAALK